MTYRVGLAPCAPGMPRATTARTYELRGAEMIGRLIQILAVLTASATLAGCELIGNVFQAGVWVGVIVVVGIIGLVIFIISRLFR